MENKLYHWIFSQESPFDFDLQIFHQPLVYPLMDFHGSIHLNLILNSKMTGKVGNRVFCMKQYDFQVTAPWELHGDNHVEKDLQIISITADPDMLLGNLLDYRQKALTLFLMEPEERFRLLNTPATREVRIACCSTLTTITGDTPRILKIRRWFAIQEMLAELLDKICDVELPETSFQLYLKLSRASDLFKEGRHITIKEAADACSLSVSRFSHLFRQIYRMSFSEYEMRTRLNRAAILLRQGISVKVAAAQEGFYDSSHFSKHFLRQFGIVPGKFR